MLRNRSKLNLAAFAAVAFSVGLATPVYAQSEADCAARADRAAREGPSVVGSTAGGAAGGAVFGALVGGKKGAKRGAAAGAVVGGASRVVRDSATYKRVYDECMANRNLTPTQ